MHLILPYAASHALDMPSAVAGLQLPNLQALLQGLTLADCFDEHEALSPHMPHERVLARTLGWPDQGPWPWAAWQTAQALTPAVDPQTPQVATSVKAPLTAQVRASCAATTPDTSAQAWLSPCHWQVGMNQVVLMDPAALALRDEESQALMAAVQPLLQEDGLQLRWHDALHWHASGELLQDLPTASLERVIGQNLRHWLQAGSPGSAARTLSRLQSEVQMLLYHHPVNEAREAQRLPTVNAFWLHGAGRLPASHISTPAAPEQTTPGQQKLCIHLRTDLRDSARQGRTADWQTGWQALDRSAVAGLLAHAQSGGTVTLSLCSEDRALSFESRPLSWTQRLQRRLRPLRVVDTLQDLITP